MDRRNVSLRGDGPLNKLTETAPPEIYLCIADDEYVRHEPFPYDAIDEICWAEHQATNITVRYVLADPHILPDDTIRAVFLANGFKIKPGHDDLKPYVYQAARALLALALGAEPA